jgi:hypothetical protein
MRFFKQKMHYSIRKNKKPRRSNKTKTVYLNNKRYEISCEIYDYIQQLEMEKYSVSYTCDEWEHLNRRGGFSSTGFKK